MKRLLLVFLLVTAVGGAAYGTYIWKRPVNPGFDCEIRWLSHKLELSPAQTARVRELHLRYCPTMNGLKGELDGNTDPGRQPALQQACRDSSARLVEAMSAELTPSQKQVYRELLESRSRKPKRESP